MFGKTSKSVPSSSGTEVALPLENTVSKAPVISDTPVSRIMMFDDTFGFTDVIVGVGVLNLCPGDISR